MGLILIGILVIIVINIFFCVISYYSEKNVANKYSNLPLLKDEKYNRMLEDLIIKFGIKKKVILAYDSNSKQENCAVKEYQDKIYIIVRKLINEEKIYGTLAHELGHVKMNHQEKTNLLGQELMFIVNIMLISFLSYPLVSPKIFCYIILASWGIFAFFMLGYQPYHLRIHELEADGEAVKVVGFECMEKSLLATRGLNKIIGSIPLPYQSHPTTKSRVKNIRKIYSKYQKLNRYK